MSLFVSQKGFAPILAILILVIIGVGVYFGLQPWKNSSSTQTNSTVQSVQAPSSLQKAVSDEVSVHILKDIMANGISCGLENAKKDINLTKGSCKVDKVVGDYAKGQMSMAYWIAKKIDGKWKAVITGNGIPQCSEIDKYSIPREIYGNCIEPSTELRH